MKKFFTLILVTLFGIGCQNLKEEEKSQIVPPKGEVVVKNGMGGLDTIPYNCSGCQELMTPEQFQNLADDVTQQCQDILVNEISFIPRKLDIIAVSDTIYWWDSGELIDSVITTLTEIEYIAKNGMGIELGGRDRFITRFVGGRIRDISGEFKLDSLEFKDGIINRSLTAWVDENFIEVLPTNKKSLIVKSSISCIDKGAWLIFKLEGGGEVKLISWNEFNCEGRSYYNWFTKSQIELLKSNRIESILLVDDKSVAVIVPNNKGDYFQQLIKLLP